MKWLSVSNNSRQEIYELWNNEEKLLTLTFQPVPGTLRIITGDEKRVFLVGAEGFLRSRTVLRNEYGIRICQLSFENSQDNSGMIEFNKEKLNYIIHKGLLMEVAILKQNEQLVLCGLPSLSKKNSSSYNFLILALCWYMFSVAKKPVAAYA